MASFSLRIPFCWSREVLLRMEKYQEAFLTIGQAMRIYEGIHGTNSQFTFDCFLQMASLKYKEKAYHQALQCYEKALAIGVHRVSIEFHDLCEVYLNIIDAVISTGELENLEKHTKAFFDILIQRVSPFPSKSKWACGHFSLFHCFRGVGSFQFSFPWVFLLISFYFPFSRFLGEC